jgi:hypothetical protein
MGSVHRNFISRASDSVDVENKSNKWICPKQNVEEKKQLN